MPSKPAFEGKRLAFLSGEKDRYYAAVKNMIGPDVVKDIQRKFLLRFNIDLPSTEEPSDEFLESIDDSKPAPEYPVPDPDSMSEEEYENKNKTWKARQKRVQAKKRVSHMEVIDKALSSPRANRHQQIKRWLEHQYNKVRTLLPSLHPPISYHGILPGQQRRSLFKVEVRRKHQCLRRVLGQIDRRQTQ